MGQNNLSHKPHQFYRSVLSGHKDLKKQIKFIRELKEFKEDTKKYFIELQEDTNKQLSTV